MLMIPAKVQELASKSLIHYGKPKDIRIKRGKKDDYTLQVIDVLIEFNDLKLFIEQQLAINSDKNFILNLDKNVPQEKVDELVIFILKQDSTINLYRTNINEEKQCIGILPIERC